jgi:hypothetical protein
MAEYIERETAIAKLTALEVTEPIATMIDAKRLLAEMPAADVTPVVHGIWIPVYESEMSGWNPAVAGLDPIGGYICSACKNEAVYDCNDKFVLSDYCPNCGAKMDGDADDEQDKG